MTLSIEELKNDVIMAWCKNCRSQAKFKPAEPTLIKKEIWDFRAGYMAKKCVRKKPEFYRCTRCGESMFFPSLASLQIHKYHAKNGEKQAKCHRKPTAGAD